MARPTPPPFEGCLPDRRYPAGTRFSRSQPAVWTDLARARDALTRIDPSCDRETWIQVGMAAKAAGLTLEDFDTWSAAGEGYKPATTKATWRSFRAEGGIGPGTLFHHARQAGWLDPRSSEQCRAVSSPPSPRRPLQATEPDSPVEHERVARHARILWDGARPADSHHPYCQAKGISAEGLRVGQANELLVPLYAATTGQLVNLQRIYPDGTKRFLTGGQKSGCHFRLAGSGAPIFAEGLATAWTVRAATGRTVVVTFDAGNLPKVAALLAKPGSVVAADNDNREKPGSPFGRKAHTYGTGHRKALATGLPFYLPPVPGYDFNDLGIEQTQAVFSRPPVSDIPVFKPQALIRPDLGNARIPQLAKQLEQLSDPEQAASLAVALADRLGLQAPARMSVIQIRAFLEAHLQPAVVHPSTLDAIVERLEYFQSQRQSATLAAVDIPAEIKARHDYQQLKTLPRLQPEDFQGVLVVRAPMGTGKTQQIGRPFAQQAIRQAAGRFLGICHRVSLVAELTHRLDADHTGQRPPEAERSIWRYDELIPEMVPRARGLVTCLPSINRPEHAPLIDQAAFVFIDEVSQVLRFLESEAACKAGNSSNRDIHDRLRQIVTQARCLVVADAGVDPRTLAFLESCRPNERLRILDVLPSVEGIKATYSTGASAEANVVGDCLAELAAGGKVWLAVESKRRAAALDKLFRSYGWKPLTVTADNKGNPAQQAFLQNIETESRHYDIVVASPVISSGISVEHRDSHHFTLGAFIGSGAAITPADAQQMLRRVRYLKRYTLGLLPNKTAGAQSADALLASWEKAARIEGTATQASDFDAWVAGIRAGTANQRADFAAGLIWLLQANRWTLHRADNPTVASKVAQCLKQFTAQEKVTQRRTLKAAPLLSDAEARHLERTPERTELQSLHLEAHRIRRALNIDALTDSVLDFWDHGQALLRLKRFNAYQGIVHHNDSQEALSRRRYGKACARAYSYLFEGLDLEKDYWLNEWSAQLILDRIMAQRHLLAHLGIVAPRFAQWRTDRQGHLLPMKRPARPVAVVAELLERMGLKLSAKQTRNVHTAPFDTLDKYAPSVYSRSDMPTPKRGRIYRVTPASLAQMHFWSERRNETRPVTAVPLESLAWPEAPVELSPVRLEEPQKRWRQAEDSCGSLYTPAQALEYDHPASSAGKAPLTKWRAYFPASIALDDGVPRCVLGLIAHKFSNRRLSSWTQVQSAAAKPCGLLRTAEPSPCAEATAKVDMTSLYRRFFVHIPMGHILDVGCGSGQDTRCFIQAAGVSGDTTRTASPLSYS